MASPAKKFETKSNHLELLENQDAHLSNSEESDLKAFRDKKRQPPAEESELWLVSYADMMTLLACFFIILVSFSKIDAGEFEKMKKEVTKVFGGEYTKPFEDISTSLKKVVEEKHLSDQVFITENEDGVQITFRGALFFDSGSAELKTEARDLLSPLVATITDTAQGFGLIIEGHTDSQPIYSKVFPSNWELSSFRASTVLRYFLEKGFNPDMIKSIGYGDRRPVVPNQDKNGSPLPENQSQNRRVVIKILKDFE